MIGKLAREQVVRKIRLLRTVAREPAARPRKRLPRQAQPDAIRLEYFKAIRPVCAAARRALEQVQPEIMQMLVDANAARSDASGRLDAQDPAEKAARLIDAAQRRAVDSLRPDALHAIAARFGQRTSNFQRQQLDEQVRAAISVPLSSIEPPVRDHIETFAALNVDLIKTVPERYFDRVRLDVQDAFERGTRPESLAAHLVDRFDMSEDDARRIARDQIGKLNGQVNQARQEALGVERFEWCTVQDERVRESHAELNGRVFSWDEPPIDEDTGEEITPGSAIQCRCWASPIFAEILGDVDGEEAGAAGGEDDDEEPEVDDTE